MTERLPRKKLFDPWQGWWVTLTTGNAACHIVVHACSMHAPLPLKVNQVQYKPQHYVWLKSNHYDNLEACGRHSALPVEFYTNSSCYLMLWYTPTHVTDPLSRRSFTIFFCDVSIARMRGVPPLQDWASMLASSRSLTSPSWAHILLYPTFTL